MSNLIIGKHYPTREKIVEIACTLMRKKGFHATTLDDILKELGMSKGSFFYYFKSKEALGYAVIERFRERLMNFTSLSLGQVNKSPMERLNLHFENLINDFSQHECPTGCPFGMLAQELSERHPGFRLRLAEIFDESSGLWQKLLEEAKAIGELYEAVDCKALADFLVGDLQGALLLMKTTQDVGRLKRHLFHTRDYLTSLRAY
ncbi:MAG: TetR/AcrR family transcriptional regulator [Verrucomicrobiia bacterium]